MDRHLRVLMDGTLFAEMLFTYERENMGNVRTTIYNSYEIEGTDERSVYPLYTDDRYVHHNPFKSMAEMQAYDSNLLNDRNENVTGKLEFQYDPIQFRYILGNPARDLTGIADIFIDFAKDKKEMIFISTKEIRFDMPANTNALEYNVGFIKRVFQEWLQQSIYDIKLVGYSLNYYRPEPVI